MKFLFRNTDNIFMLKDYTCVYKNQHGVNVLTSIQQEYEILKKIFLCNDITDNEYKNNKRFLNKLLKNNYIIELPKDIETNQKLFKTFQYLLMTNKISSLDKFKNFQNRKVLIVGLGGTALEVVRQLVSLDFKNYILVDFDIVNETNLNRQFLFQKSDIGLYKIDVVEKFIHNNVENSNIVKYNKKISSSDDIHKIISENNSIDIVMCCADTPPIDIELFILSEVIDSKIAYLGSGVGIYKGSVGPLLVDHKHKSRYIEMLNKSKNILETLTNCSASYGITNSIISTLMANECIEYLLNNNTTTLNRTLIYYFDNHNVEFIDI